MKWIRISAKIIGILLAACVVFILISIEPVQDVPLKQISTYQQTLDAIAQWSLFTEQDTSTQFMAGWSKESIMPDQVSPMAGYRYRSAFESVHDSLFCRVFVFKKGKKKAAMVALDLLIFPPSVTKALREKLKSSAWQPKELYLSATHTHNGTGNWAEGLYGIFVSGGYDNEYVDKITNAILTALKRAETDIAPCKLGYSVMHAPQYVRNRLTDKGKEDDKLKVLKFKKENGSEAAIVSFTAHPTTISSRHLSISNDYPYYLGVTLEKHPDIDFSAFFAGPMGSHGPEGQKGNAPDYFALSKQIGEGLASEILNSWEGIPLIFPTQLGVGKIPFYFDDLHIRLLPQWRTRQWLFEAVAGKQPMFIDVLQLGALTMISTPCDLSGELALSIENTLSPNRQLMINNFNGAYIGYITPDQYYFEITKPETMEMNWLGPNNGSLMKNILLKIIDKTQSSM